MLQTAYREDLPGLLHALPSGLCPQITPSRKTLNPEFTVLSAKLIQPIRLGGEQRIGELAKHGGFVRTLRFVRIVRGGRKSDSVEAQRLAGMQLGQASGLFERDCFHSPEA